MRTQKTQIVGQKLIPAAAILLGVGITCTQLTADVGEFTQLIVAQDTVQPTPAVTPDPSQEVISAAEESTDSGIRQITAKVLAVEGVVEYRMTLDDTWQTPLQVGAELPEGAQVRTGLRSSVRLQIGPASEVTINRLTIATIGQLHTDGNVLRSNIAMQHGKVDFSVRQSGFQNDFKISTPAGTMAVKGTQGSLTSDEDTDIDGNDNGDDAINYTNNSNNQNSSFGGDDDLDDGEGGGGGGGGGDGEGGGGGGGGPDTDTLNGNESFNQNMNQFINDLPEDTGGDA